MRGIAAVQFLPSTLRAEQALLVRVVVLGVERKERHRLLEREEAEVTVDPAEHLELVAQEVVDLAPGAHVQHAAGEVRSADGDLLAYARAHADQAHQVDVAEAQVIEQPDRVVGVQLHRGRHGEVVARVADAAVVEQDHLVAIDQAAGEVPVVFVAERAPAAHAEHGLSLAEDFVVHRMVVDRRDGHGFACPVLGGRGS